MGKQFKKLWIYFLLFMVIVIGNVLTFSVAGTGIKISEILLIISFLVFAGFIFRLKLPESILTLFVWAIWSLILIVFNTVIRGYTVSEVIVAIAYLFRYVYTIFFAFVLAKYVLKYYSKIRLLNVVNNMYIITCILGFIILLIWPSAYDFYDMLYSFGVYFPDPDPHINRIISTYLDPNYYSCCLCIGFTVNLYLLLKEDSKKIIYKIFLCIYLVTMVLTKSRSGILCVAITVALYYLSLKKWTRRQIAVAIIVAVIGLYLLLFSDIDLFVRLRSGLDDGSSQARFTSWQKGLNTFLDTYGLGLGYNLIGSYFTDIYGSIADSTGYGLDSSILLMFVTTGFLGIVIYGYHLYKILGEGRVPKLFICLYIGSFIAAFFNNLLFYFLWLFPFYFVVYLFAGETSKNRFKSETKLLNKYKEKINPY